MLRGIPLPPIVYPLAAFLLWTFLVFSYLGVVESDLDFPRQILQADFFLSNLILVLAWFLSGQALFTVVAASVAVLAVYLSLALRDGGLWVQIGAIAVLWFWLQHLSRQIDNEKLVH